MENKWKAVILTAALIFSNTPSSFAAPQQNSQGSIGANGITHVLLISIDGMHAVDYQNCVAAGNCQTLAALGKTA